LEIKDFSEDGEKHHHHHHHHHSSRKEQKRRKWIKPALIVSIVVVVVVTIALGFYIRSTETFTTEEKASSSGNTELRYKDVSYQGEKYKYNNRITTILLSGLDSEGPLQTYPTYSQAPRADSNTLIVIDTQNKKLTMIGLDRNTITDYKRYGFDGTDYGYFKDFLCWAYTCGDGGEVSCENLREAVSKLLYDIPVNRYVIANRSTLEGFAELVGPVEVEVPNDDLAPEFMAGTTVTIDKDNIERFVRYRDTSKDFTNESRMERQKAYLTAAANQLVKTLKDNPQECWKKLDSMNSYIQTDISKSQYLDIINDLGEVDLEEVDYIIPEGRLSAEGSFDEFYPDEEKLLDLVVNTFYMKK
jgi:anionic cell wall polymer biosynthesis LytR-Cps2A-Psr (LCP) family protein